MAVKEDVEFEVLIVMSVKMAIIWDVLTCSIRNEGSKFL